MTQIDAPKAAEEIFPEPLEFAALLGLQGQEAALQDSQIISAFEELSASPLEDGYSQKVEEGRGALLHAAVDGVRRLRSMSVRSDSSGLVMQEARVALVQWRLLPAALSLLQETGQSELVLDYSSIALSLRESQPYRRDILISMALAHCSLSSDAFGDKEKVGLGCAHLEEALSLLEEAGMAPGNSKLATEIQKGLQDLKPHCLLEHLKVPLEKGGKNRRQATAVLKSLLANPDLAAKGDGSTAVDRAFVRKAFGLLSSQETVDLLDWQDLLSHKASVPWYFDELLERGVMAHIVAGFVSRRPAVIEDGLRLLRGRFHSDLLLLGVISYVLLADTRAACRLLMEAESRGYFRREATGRMGMGSPRGEEAEKTRALPAKHDTLSFIRMHSPEGDSDLLPGLCLFGERWLSQVALPRFVDTGAGYTAASLTSYFEIEEVHRYLSAKTRDRSDLPANVAVLAAKLTQRWHRAQAAPLSTRNAHKHKAIELPRLPLPDGAASGRVRLPAAAQPPPRATRKLLGMALVAAAGVAAVTVTRRLEPLAAEPVTTQIPVEQAAEVSLPRVWNWRAPWQRGEPSGKLLTRRAAEACIRRWQVAKALTMGPRHDESLLDQALTEPYLSTVRGEAAAARKAGWFWSYKPSRLHVESVECNDSGEAVVVARQQERGELFAVTGKRADAHCYDNGFQTEYVMKRDGGSGAWRISRVLVLGDNNGT